MKNQFTPGPWHVEKDGYVHSADSKMILKFARGTDADATLISAAPEMLEALEAVCFDLEAGKPFGLIKGDLEMIQKIILKARGELK